MTLDIGAEFATLLDDAGETFIFPDGTEVTVIRYEQTSDELGRRSEQTRIWCRSSTVETVRIGDVCYRNSNGDKFIVRDREPDGFNGVERLILDKQAI